MEKELTYMLDTQKVLRALIHVFSSHNNLFWWKTIIFLIDKKLELREVKKSAQSHTASPKVGDLPTEFICFHSLCFFSLQCLSGVL